MLKKSQPKRRLNAHMRGYIRKRGKWSWELTVYRGRLPTGKPDRVIQNFKGNKRDADAALADLVRKARTGSTIDDKKITVREFLESWLRDVASSLAPKTFERYEQVIRLRALPAIGHLRISKVQPYQIQELYAEWATEKRMDKKRGGLSARSIVHHHRVLRNAFQQAVRMQLVASNVFDSVKTPKCNKIAMSVLDEDEAAKLLRAAEGNDELYVPVAIGLLTGLRRGEILALRWSAIDWNGKQLSVLQSLSQPKGRLHFGPPKTASSRRTVSLSPLLIDILKKHRTRQGMDRWKFKEDYASLDLVVAQEDGNPVPPQRLSDRFRAFISHVDVPKVRFHDLRHSHATHAMRQRVPAKVISERLGHSSVAITLDLYSHVLEGMQEDGAMRVDEAIQAALAKLA
jgi:integrase